MLRIHKGTLHYIEEHLKFMWKLLNYLFKKGVGINIVNKGLYSALDQATTFYPNKQNADLLRKHSGKTGEELEAAGN